MSRASRCKRREWAATSGCTRSSCQSNEPDDPAFASDILYKRWLRAKTSLELCRRTDKRAEYAVKLFERNRLHSLGLVRRSAQSRSVRSHSQLGMPFVS